MRSKQTFNKQVPGVNFCNQDCSLILASVSNTVTFGGNKLNPFLLEVSLMTMMVGGGKGVG